MNQEKTPCDMNHEIQVGYYMDPCSDCSGLLQSLLNPTYTVGVTWRIGPELAISS